MPDSTDPPNKVLIDAVLASLKHGVIFLVDNEALAIGGKTDEMDCLVKKTEKLAFKALSEQFGEDAARKFFVKSENPWILRTAFGGWIFFYPIEVLTPETSMVEIGEPDFVYWPDADGTYARVPWVQWSTIRERGNVWRPTSAARAAGGPRSVWDRLRDP